MRPAFYALAPGGWRDYVTLIHLPYTAWHLSYVVIGACLAPHVPGWRLVLTVVAFGAFIAVAYNLELFGGLFHNPFWLAAGWGAFPVLTAYFAMADRITGEAVLTALFAALLIRAQQVLSTPVRDVRRRTISVTGTIERRDGTSVPIGPETLTGPPETALRFMAAASVSLAAALLVLRFV